MPPETLIPRQKKFCIAGRVIPSIHYFIPHRLNWDRIRTLIVDMNYFVLHAPRQSGKTTAIRELAQHLTNTGSYAALYINIESSQAARENFEKALIGIANCWPTLNITEKLGEEYNDLSAYLRSNSTSGTISVTFLLDSPSYACKK